MQCNGLTIPGSDSRFFFPPNSATISTGRSTNSTVPFLARPVFLPQIWSKSKSRSKSKAAAFSDGAAAVATEVAAEASFYELLGIPESGSLWEIKQAYKQLARKYHPDVSPPDRVEEYTRRFLRVQEAYETLSDPSRRAIYDRDMANGLHMAFSARKRYESNEGVELKSEWKIRWQSQLSELKRRSMNKDEKGDMSWGARMRRRSEDLSDKL